MKIKSVLGISLDSNILTLEGWKTQEEVKIGDFLYVLNGEGYLEQDEVTFIY